MTESTNFKLSNKANQVTKKLFAMKLKSPKAISIRQLV